MTSYKLHFVCRGNMYRSRLAEAFMNTLDLPGYHISSSGIEADRYYGDALRDLLQPYTKEAAESMGAFSALAPHRRQTTNAMLDEADIIVFMNKDVYRNALRLYTFNRLKAVVWDISDLRGKRYQAAMAHNIRRNSLLIPTRCRALAKQLRQIGWVDIIDEQNEPLHFKLPLSWAVQKRLWFRGCHVVLTTPAGKYVVEKRSRTITFSPGQLDISLGGFVDAGEQPIHAAARETKEELGLDVDQSQFRLLDIRKQNHWHPRYRRRTSLYLYTYHAQLKDEKPVMTLQQSEVAAARLLTARQVTTLLRRHRLLRFGRLKYGYKYYQDLVRATQARPV